MITAQHIKPIISAHLQPAEVVHCMELYAALPFSMRQTCAEQLVAEPTLVPFFYQMLKNENAFMSHTVSESGFLHNERALIGSLGA